MQVTLVNDKSDPSVIRVEAVDDDGGCEVAIFSGPNAQPRAVSFAENYYDDWEDETE